jgi:hypothetical protein
MTKFTDHLWSDLMQEHGTEIANASRPRQSRIRHPRAIAGGTLALAVAGTALGLGLTSTGSTTGSTSVQTAAYTITTHSNGSILVKMHDQETVNAVNQQLEAMVKEYAILDFKPGPAPVSGPVTCTPGVPNMGGPQVQVLLDADGTQVIAPGTTGDNTGVGTWHIGSCVVYPQSYQPKGSTGTVSGVPAGTVVVLPKGTDLKTGAVFPKGLLVFPKGTVIKNGEILPKGTVKLPTGTVVKIGSRIYKIVAGDKVVAAPKAS